jgi:hypothetical protein
VGLVVELDTLVVPLGQEQQDRDLLVEPVAPLLAVLLAVVAVVVQVKLAETQTAQMLVMAAMVLLPQ